MNNDYVNRKWVEYFDEWLRMIGTYQCSATIPRCLKCYVEIEYDDINGAVKRLKGGKSPGIDEVKMKGQQ